MPADARLQAIEATWDELADSDPYWAIASWPGTRGNRWNVQEFFRIGSERVAYVLDHFEKLGVALPGGPALDFGCGVGRHTQALTRQLGSAVGVDIAPSMIRRANQLNTEGERCHYLVNSTPDLGSFPTESFSLVFSQVVLQHMPRALARGYLREFARVVRRGGVIYFTLPSGFSSRALSWLPYGVTDAAFNRIRNSLRKMLRRSSVGWETHWTPPAALLPFTGNLGLATLDCVREKPLTSERLSLGMDNFAYYLRRHSSPEPAA